MGLQLDSRGLRHGAGILLIALVAAGVRISSLGNFVIER